MNILDNYPVFESNQVLTSEQLNNLIKYLDQQNRLTRTQLIGIGNVCGFHIKYESTENALTITKGVGITSEGFLIEQVDCSTRWYRKYDYTKLKIKYPPFEDITDEKHNLDVELFELLSTTTDPTNEFPLSEKFLSNKVVLLFLEIFDQDLKTCLAKSCDEIGQTRIFTIRKLLISTKDMDKVLQKLYLESYDPTFPNKFKLPVITMPRVNIKYDEVAAKDKTSLLKKYNDSIETVKNSLFDAIKLTFKIYNPILKDLYQKDYFGVDKIIDKKILDWENYLDGDLYGIQYFYDFIKDLTLAYDEFKNTAFELSNECIINMERFPLHLMLGPAIPDKDYNIDSTQYRNRFIQSPAYSAQKYLTLKARSLHKRMVSMIISFDLEYISKTDTKIKDIHVIPSNEKLSKLSERSIPFYYNPDNKDIPLIDYWNFDTEKRKLSNYILSYHHIKSPYPLEVKSTLKYDIDKYSFLRLEGLLGKEINTAKNILEQHKKDYNLSFKIVSLQLNPSTKELILDPAQWCDLEVLYFNARLSYLDVFQKLSYDIKIIKSFNLPLKFTSINVDDTQKQIDDVIKNLPEKINDFIFQDFFKSYCLLLELLQVYKINIIHYQGRLINELINVTTKDDFQKGIIQINTSLAFIQRILDFGVYKELYLLFNRLENRKKRLIENHPTIFSNFLKENPGLNHEGGTKDNGTIVLVSELDVTDSKYKVFADFSLPYLCCCDCNEILCSDDQVEYSKLPLLALPDGVVCEINLPVEIDVLNNDYIPTGQDFVLTSSSPLVKCDQQKKLITYTRNDDFTGLDTFTYNINRNITLEDADVQPAAAKKKKVVIADENVHQESLSSTKVKVLIHNKYQFHIQANDDIQIVAQHDDLKIDVLSNDIAYNTTVLKLLDTTTPQDGKIEITNISGKDLIKYTPQKAGKDSFKYQLVDEKRGEQSEATVTIFVTKFDLTVSDTVFLVTSTGINNIPINLPAGCIISEVPTLSTGMGTIAITPSKTSIQFTPGAAFIDNKSLNFNYQLTNDKGESIKGVVHLVNALTEYTIPDIVYRVTRSGVNLISIDYATQNVLSIENSITTSPSNIGTISIDNINRRINFTPNANFANLNTSKIVYNLKNALGFLTKGEIHLVNGLKENQIPDVIFQVTALGRSSIPVNYAIQNSLTVKEIISNIPPDVGTLSFEKNTILFDSGINYQNQNTLSFNYVLSQSDGETITGNGYLINSIKQSEDYKDFFSDVMAGTVMAFAFDTGYDVVLKKIGSKPDIILKLLVNITRLTEAEAKKLMGSLPSVIKKSIPSDKAGEIKNSLEIEGATVELDNWFIRNGWLICDGSPYNRKKFERLFNRIGILYGAGNKDTTFNVPDLRSQFIRGWESGRAPGIATWQNEQFQLHTHRDPSHRHPENHTHNFSTFSIIGHQRVDNNPWSGGADINQVVSASPQGTSSKIPMANTSDLAFTNIAEPISYGNSGAVFTGTETRPKNLAVVFCIKY